MRRRFQGEAGSASVVGCGLQVMDWVYACSTLGTRCSARCRMDPHGSVGACLHAMVWVKIACRQACMAGAVLVLVLVLRLASGVGRDDDLLV